VLAAAALDGTAQKRRGQALRPDAADGVPPAPADPLAEFEPWLALKRWDRERGYVKPASAFPMADLYLCWSPGALYLGVYAQDVVEPAFYRDNRVPEEDRAAWTVWAGDTRREICARVGAGAAATVHGPAARVVRLSGLELNTRCVAAMELAPSLFGHGRFQAGDRVQLASAFRGHCRAYGTEWKGTFTLRK